MIKAIRKAYGSGYRAGMAVPRLVAAGGRRGVRVIDTPLNPYRNVFTAPWGNGWLAWVWESGRYEGMLKRLTRKGAL